ncbi:NTP pyrophosphatase (non-canonical NTP hydrolase) [Microbulbifer rhizosphaerae]|uniref:NTP pyrophosphatase (Non-canonical NTP hydrolase) n=2 Tax=Microbulbifer rhizosphaerae TaxID=1562603 RepID=A0A7W4WDI7_9GAMM|nr:NTP pyrophosphatase (non-canonical NTP hydrolase) [Microbulbifer rhizosphaerae]
MNTAAVLAAFDEIARRRNWQSLHLAMALSVEVAELCRHLQWLDDGQVERMLQSDEAESVAAELADIQMYLLKLAAVMDIDLNEALADKIAENRRRF